MKVHGTCGDCRGSFPDIVAPRVTRNCAGGFAAELFLIFINNGIVTA